MTVMARSRTDDAAIDALVPPLRPRWQRAIIGIVVIALAGFGANLWRTGAFFPQPDCCGSASGDDFLALTPEGDAATVTAYFNNSSPRDILVAGARADFDGATVSRVDVLDPEGPILAPFRLQPLPYAVPAHRGVRIAVTFTPDSCVDLPTERYRGTTVELFLEKTGGGLSWGTSRLLVIDSSVGSDLVVEGPGADALDGRGMLPTSDGGYEGEWIGPVAAACAMLAAVG